MWTISKFFDISLKIQATSSYARNCPSANLIKNPKSELVHSDWLKFSKWLSISNTSSFFRLNRIIHWTQIACKVGFHVRQIVLKNFIFYKYKTSTYPLCKTTQGTKFSCMKRIFCTIRGQLNNLQCSLIKPAPELHWVKEFLISFFEQILLRSWS